MRIFLRVSPGGVSNDGGVVDDGNFWRFGWPFFGNVRDKTSNIT